jgi:hypothetical protein
LKRGEIRAAEGSRWVELARREPKKPAKDKRGKKSHDPKPSNIRTRQKIFNNLERLYFSILKQLVNPDVGLLGYKYSIRKLYKDQKTIEHSSTQLSA